MARIPTPAPTKRLPPLARPGHRYVAYWLKPMSPDAISSGPLSTKDQMNRKAMNRPHFWGP